MAVSKRQTKAEIVTFKADRPLLEAMNGISNRSEFIRAAVLTALDSLCPLCRGSGILTPDQRKHWDAFALHHGVAECDDCHAIHLVCSAGPQKTPHAARSKGRRK